MPDLDRNRSAASVADVKRLRELEVENAKLKRMYAAVYLLPQGD